MTSDVWHTLKKWFYRLYEATDEEEFDHRLLDAERALVNIDRRLGRVERKLEIKPRGNE